jgi:phosphatidylglycerophosphate synthase
MAAQGKSSSVAVAQIGRFKTAAQMGAIGCLLLSEDIIPYINTVLLGNILLYIAVILTLVSMFYYLQAAYKVFRQAAMD